MSYPDVRSVRGTAAHGSTITVSRPTVQTGDILIAIHSADNLASLGVSDGGWTLLHQRGSDPQGWSGTRVYGRTVTNSGLPHSFTFTQGSDCDGVAVVLAISNATLTGIKIASRRGGSSDDIVAPGLTPDGAGWLDLRYVAGTVLQGAALSWAVPLEPVLSEQSGIYTSVAVCKQQLISSTPTLPAEFLPIELPPDIWDAITLLVPPSSGAGTGGGTPPTPLPLPSFTPGRGAAKWRFTVHRLADGQYIEDVFPNDIELTWRIGEPGTLDATLSIPNSAEAMRIAAMIPATPDDLSIGPGQITIQARRNGVPWGEWWINGAILEQARGSTNVQVALRGNTLDAYLHQVLVKQMINLSGDELAVARSLLAHMKNDPLANIKLSVQGGTSGVSRAFTAAPDGRLTYGEALATYAQGGSASQGFEYQVIVYEEGGDYFREMIWGAPRLGTGTEHVFQQGYEGGDVTSWRIEIDALRGMGTHLRVRGGTPEAEDATEAADPVFSSEIASSAHIAAGWRRIDRTIDHPGESTNTTVLNQYGERMLARFAGAIWVRSVSVVLGEDISFHPSRLGDLGRVILTNQWHRIVGGTASHDISERIIGITIRPNYTGPDHADLILESQVST